MLVQIPVEFGLLRTPGQDAGLLGDITAEPAGGAGMLAKVEDGKVVSVITWSAPVPDSSGES
ncbi:hypothetical protein [Spirillospora albida]|uniref:hypothetical protein n=1 Tax=Spirillospora albida TaxID=58123 RepID=UPI0004C17ABA|nr:hypothetical protein [Spirillospora albida]